MQTLFRQYTLPLTFMLIGHSYAAYATHSQTNTPNLNSMKQLSEKELLTRLYQQPLSGKKAADFMHKAARKGYLSVVTLLISQNECYTQFQKQCAIPQTEAAINHFALTFACEHGYTKIVATLIRKGVQIDRQDQYSCTPLFYAAGRGHLDIVKTLIENGADTTVTDVRNNTLLHAAAYAGHDDVVSFLLSQGMNPNAGNRAHETPLHQAARKDHTTTVKILLKGKADVNSRAEDHRTALHHAAIANNTDMIACLLDHDAPTLAIDLHNNTPLEYALKQKSAEAACLLLQQYKSRDLKRHHNLFIFGNDTFVTHTLWGLLEYLVNDATGEIRDFFHDLSLVRIKKVTNKTKDWLKTPLGHIWHIIHAYTSPYCKPQYNPDNPLYNAQNRICSILEKKMPKDLAKELFTFLPAPWFISKKRGLKEIGQSATKPCSAKRPC